MSENQVKLQQPGGFRLAIYNAIRRIRPIQIGVVIKRLLRIRRFYIRIPSGTIFWIDPVSNLGLFLLNRGSYEDKTHKAIADILRPGDTFVDIGANEGYFSMVAAKIVGERGRVLAIEPQGRLAEVIRRNAAANGWSEIVAHHQLGFGAREGEFELHLAPDINTGASSFTRYWRFGGSVERIRALPFDTFAAEQKLEKIRLVKIDCEGAEFGVIGGANRLLAERKIEYIIVEYHPHIIGQEAVIQTDATLKSHGYQIVDSGEFTVYQAEKN